MISQRLHAADRNHFDVWSAMRRKKGLPRGKSFEKGERLPFQFKPGLSENLGGRAKSRQKMKIVYESPSVFSILRH